MTKQQIPGKSLRFMIIVTATEQKIINAQFPFVWLDHRLYKEYSTVCHDQNMSNTKFV